MGKELTAEERAVRSRAEAIRTKLRNEAKRLGCTTDFLIFRYANERFLARLERSPYRDRILLKGGTLISVMMDREGKKPPRMSADLDVTHTSAQNRDEIERMIRDVLSMPGVPPVGYSEAGGDGLLFDLDRLAQDPIMQGADDAAVRLRVPFALGEFSKRLDQDPRLALDISTGQPMARRPLEFEFPSILGGKAARIMAYDAETVLAEKIETMVRRGTANTRMRDYYDVWQLMKRPYDGRRLAESFRETFRARGTSFPTASPDGLAPPFVASKHEDWEKFRRETWLGEAPPDLKGIVAAIRPFAIPLIATAGRGSDPGTWNPGIGKWQQEPAAAPNRPAAGSEGAITSQAATQSQHLADTKDLPRDEPRGDEDIPDRTNAPKT